MIEVAYRQQKEDNKRQSFSRPSHSSQSSSVPTATSPQHPHPSSFLGASPDFSAPLQIKTLKAPPSPLVSSAPEHPSLLANVHTSDSDQNIALVDQIRSTDPSSRNTTMANPSSSAHHVGSSSPGNGHVKRVRRGQKLEEIQPTVEQAPALQQIDSPFQLQEYLALLIRQDPHDVERIVNLPQATIAPTETFTAGKGKGREGGGIDGEGSDHFTSNGGIDTFMGGEEEPHQVDTDVWVYEQLRRIVSDFTTPWLISLQRECDRKRKPTSCDAMNADDWMYLCASHGEEKQCCAIDYIIHTLDGTTALLNSHRHFPSRTYIPNTSLRHFGSISRRLSRIFVHAYEHHRDVFEACEAETSLYARFLKLVQSYDLVAMDSLPQLGKAQKNKKSQNADEIPSLSTSMSIRQPEENFERSLAQGRGLAPANRTLFEHDDTSGVPKDADNEDEDELAEENEDDSPRSAARLERSDSNASRITAIHIDSLDISSDDDERNGKEERTNS